MRGVPLLMEADGIAEEASGSRSFRYIFRENSPIASDTLTLNTRRWTRLTMAIDDLHGKKRPSKLKPG